MTGHSLNIKPPSRILALDPKIGDQGHQIVAKNAGYTESCRNWLHTLTFLVLIQGTANLKGGRP
jgi:hypothetical protein